MCDVCVWVAAGWLGSFSLAAPSEADEGMRADPDVVLMEG
jgi:hypothetical protein